ncbi:hypothetical protein GO495_00055 [Chitinophaga oryziterrae]|uniref:Uncharacterized protein n=1 Tax=Chitinophaga oryziterrae TaxID=1031224 RepID=A0A6N8J2P7_9BACT|nr:hypothetical protein [Chitinophaga oryziterrae]MVT38958.1 hypothetical protein [Chitinophaga oryziterrae]
MQNFHYLVERDNRLKPWHISLYIALFNTWHKYHFTPVFRISRGLLMNASRIGSKNTFAQTLKQLNEYGYIIYQPELDKGDYPKVTIIRLTDHEIVKNQLNLFPGSSNRPDTEGRTSSVSGGVPDVNGVTPDVGTTYASVTTEAVPAQVDNKIQSSKQCKTIECETHGQKYPTLQEILSWFDKEHANEEIALAFFHHYSANGWMIGKHPIRRWQAVASKWLLTTKSSL